MQGAVPELGARAIESAAMRRLADEYDAAQDRGEVRGMEFKFPMRKLRGFRDIGLTHEAIHDARQIPDAEVAGPGVAWRASLPVAARQGAPAAGSGLRSVHLNEHPRCSERRFNPRKSK